MRFDTLHYAVMSYGYFSKFFGYENMNFYRYFLSILSGLMPTCHWLSIITKKYNLKITVVSPELDHPVPMFHSSNHPDVVIVVNGDILGRGDSTHYIATVPTNYPESVELPGNNKKPQLGYNKLNLFKNGLMNQERMVSTELYGFLLSEITSKQEKVNKLKQTIDQAERELNKLLSETQKLGVALNDLNTQNENIDPELRKKVLELKEEENETKRRLQKEYDDRFEKAKRKLEAERSTKLTKEQSEIEEKSQLLQQKEKDLNEKEKNLNEKEKRLQITKDEIQDLAQVF